MLHEYYMDLMRHSFPWCRYDNSGVGKWFSRELWGQLWSYLNHSKTFLNSSEVGRKQMEMLAYVMSGDVEQALKWPYVWLPSTCRAFRYNISSFLKYGMIRHKPILIYNCI